MDVDTDEIRTQDDSMEDFASTREGASRGGRRRPRGPKNPPVPELPVGTVVRIGGSCRSAALQGQICTVVAWGRQVEVAMRAEDGSEGELRKLNPPDLIPLDEPEPAEQGTGEEAAPAPAPARSVRSMPLGGSRTRSNKVESGDDEMSSQVSALSQATTEHEEEVPTDGSARNRRGGRQPKKELKKELPQLPLGGWVRVGDTCRSAGLRGQVGTVVAVGRQVEVQIGGEGAGVEAVRKLNPNDLVFVGMEPPEGASNLSAS